jgi:hypothetical protein
LNFPEREREKEAIVARRDKAEWRGERRERGREVTLTGRYQMQHIAERSFNLFSHINAVCGMYTYQFNNNACM